MSASDPHWWRHHFSWLGAEAGGSALDFNLTLLLAGLALVTVGDFLAHDLEVWTEATGQSHTKVTTVRILMVALGVLLALVALIPVSASRVLHDAAAQGIVVVFAATIVIIPLLFPHLPGGFRAVTAVVIALRGAGLVLWEGVGYLDTMAFEMGAAATVFVWLLLFVRSVTAAAESVDAGVSPRS